VVCVDVFRVVHIDFCEMCFRYLMYFFLCSCMRYRHAVTDVVAYCFENKQIKCRLKECVAK